MSHHGNNSALMIYRRLLLRRLDMYSKFFVSGAFALVLAGCASKSPPVSETAAPPVQSVADSTPPVPQVSEAEMMEIWKKASTPSAKHALLKQYIGNWKTESKFWQSPVQAPEVSKGTAKFTSVLGGRFIEQEFKGKMMGMPMTGKGLIGYDNAQEKFVSNWIDSMGTGVMVSSGSLEQDSNSIEMKGEFFCPLMKKNVITREVMSPVAKNSFKFEMFGPGMDGKEMKMLEVTYTR